MEEINLNCTKVFEDLWNAIQAAEPDPEFPGRFRRMWRYIVLEGSSRSSKTYSIIDAVDLYARSFADKRITVWRDTKTDTVKTVFPDIERRLKETGRWLNRHRFHATTHTLAYAGTTKLEIHGTDDDVTVHGLSGHLAWLNEPYKISRDVFDQIDQRTEDFLIIDWNPRQAHWIDDIKKDPRCIVLKSTFQDNPFCPPEQRLKILSYQPIKRTMLVEKKHLTENEARKYKTASNPKKFSVSACQELARAQENEFKRSASDYKWSVYGLGEKAEKPNRIFHWEEILESHYMELEAEEFYWCDWGAVDPWAIGKAKYIDGVLYLHELNYASENVVRLALDQTDKDTISSEDEGLVSWMFERLGIPYTATIVCDPNRKTKISALRKAGWEYAIAATKVAGSIVDGIDLLNNIQVCYTDSSNNIRHEQENYSRKVDRYGAIMEEPEDFDNHHMDGARYVGMYLENEGIIAKV